MRARTACTLAVLLLFALAHTAAAVENAEDECIADCREDALLQECKGSSGDAKTLCEKVQTDKKNSDKQDPVVPEVPWAAAAVTVTDYHDHSTVNPPRLRRSSYKHSYHGSSEEESYYAAEVQGDASTEYNHHGELANPPPGAARIPQADLTYDKNRLYVGYYGTTTTSTNLNDFFPEIKYKIRFNAKSNDDTKAGNWYWKLNLQMYLNSGKLTIETTDGTINTPTAYTISGAWGQPVIPPATLILGSYSLMAKSEALGANHLASQVCFTPKPLECKILINDRVTAKTYKGTIDRADLFGHPLTVEEWITWSELRQNWPGSKHATFTCRQLTCVDGCQ